MNTPITANFFRKIELYQEIVALNKIFGDTVWDLEDGSKNTWEIEKKVLLWTRSKHKHLGSSLKAEDFQDNNMDKLKGCRLTKEEVEDKSGGGQYWLKNLVQRGFAKMKIDENGKEDGILIDEKGLLMGAVLYDIYKPKRIKDQKLWRQKFWKTYGTKYNATHFLAKRYMFWVYKLAILVGWVVFISAAALVFWALIGKIKGSPR